MIRIKSAQQATTARLGRIRAFNKYFFLSFYDQKVFTGRQTSAGVVQGPNTLYSDPEFQIYSINIA